MDGLRVGARLGRIDGCAGRTFGPKAKCLATIEAKIAPVQIRTSLTVPMNPSPIMFLFSLIVLAVFFDVIFKLIPPTKRPLKYSDALFPGKIMTEMYILFWLSNLSCVGRLKYWPFNCNPRYRFPSWFGFLPSHSPSLLLSRNDTILAQFKFPNVLVQTSRENGTLISTTLCGNITVERMVGKFTDPGAILLTKIEACH